MVRTKKLEAFFWSWIIFFSFKFLVSLKKFDSLDVIFSKPQNILESVEHIFVDTLA